MAATYSTRGRFDCHGERSIVGVAANALDNLKQLVRGRLAFNREAVLNCSQRSRGRPGD
jgi:hypothetical protein